MRLTLIDRLDRTFELEGEEGRNALQFLHSVHIPADSVLLRVGNQYLAPECYTLRAGDAVTLEMVRAYHLPDILASLELTDQSSISGRDSFIVAPGERHPAPPPDSVYVKRALTFLDDGSLLTRAEGFTPDEMIEYVERTFADAYGSLEIGTEETAIALSGGRDSLAMTYLLAAAAFRGLDVRMRAVTVETIALPDDVPVARDACEALGISHHIVRGEEVVELMGLNVAVPTALERIRSTMGQNAAIGACHTMMRAAIEDHCRANDIWHVHFGLHNEDLLATLIRSMSSGIPFGESMTKRSWGAFTFSYPLWPLTKKELTLFLKLRAPHHASQGSPSRFDRGGLNRDINYFLADSLQSMWPELSFHLFAGWAKLNATMRGVVQSFVQCGRCRLTMISAPNRADQDLCTTCRDVELLGLVR